MQGRSFALAGSGPGWLPVWLATALGAVLFLVGSASAEVCSSGPPVGLLPKIFAGTHHRAPAVVIRQCDHGPGGCDCGYGAGAPLATGLPWQPAYSSAACQSCSPGRTCPSCAACPPATAARSESGQPATGPEADSTAPSSPLADAAEQAAEPRLDLSEQSAALASTTYAADVPSMIGDFFGSGQSSISVTRTTVFSFEAEGFIVSGAPGAPDAMLEFFIDPDSNPDFFSVGQGFDATGSGGINAFEIAEPVPPSSAPPCPPGTFDGGIAISQNAQGTFGESDFWDIVYSCTERLTLIVPNPAVGGAVVGRQKIAENGSPIPRDRVFINYSAFDNVPLSPGGVTVNRFTPGFETTFWDGMASFELRAPFAATLDSHIIADGPSDLGQVEFGNLFMTWKMLLLERPAGLVSCGLSLAVPTASELRVSLADGQELVKVENDGVHVMPFVGWLARLGDRGFTHGFLQFDFDANGNRVYVNPYGYGLEHGGRLQDSSLLYLDLGVGYWLRRASDLACCQSADSYLITGIVPTLELHYNAALQEADVVESGAFRIGQPRRDFQQVNLVLGGTLEFRRRDMLSVGYGVPVGNNADQMFDGELRCLWNRFF
ncbi:MAG: hypothetical protein J5I93_15540 [Pirellulaceae bacterium]|nr:hypothetical protein [Pirellulaceae bacterium]